MGEHLDHILVGSDLSEESFVAVDEGVRLAVRGAARLSVLHVDDGPAEGARSLLGEKIEAAISQHLGDRKRPEVEVVVQSGRPLYVLLDYAEERKCGLVVVGASRRSAMSQALLGALTQKLLVASPRNVLVCRPDKVPGFQRILVPFDLSELAREALVLASTIANDEGSELHVLHVNEFGEQARGRRIAISGETPTYQRSQEKQILVDIRNAVEEMKIQSGVVKLNQRIGAAAPEIVKFAADAACDLIVLGAPAQTGLQRLFAGSLAGRVARTAPCSLLVIKGHRWFWF